MVSGSISLPSLGFFSPFPHGTGTLSVRREYLGSPHGRGGFTRDSTRPVLLGQTVIPRRHAYGYGAITLYGQAFNPARLTRRFITRPGPVGDRTHRPATPHAQPPTGITRARFGLVRFRSPLLTEYPFLQVLRCFTSLRTPRKNCGDSP